MERKIMVVDVWKLFSVVRFEGFLSRTTVDYEAKILKNLQSMNKEQAEIDPRFKQPIPYILITNDSGMIFAYQRSEVDAEYGEKRLQGKWSWGIGGHMEESDTQDSENPIQTTMMRELTEEVDMDGDPLSFEVLGYINNTSDEVGKVHFGILYELLTNSTVVRPKDPEVAHGGLKRIEELERICLNSDLEVEEWSRIALSPLKKALETRRTGSLRS